MHERIRIHPLERPLPRLVLPEAFDHVGYNYHSPLQDATLERLGAKTQLQPADMLAVVSSEITDVENQRREFWNNDALSGKWKAQGKIVRAARRFFKKDHDANIFRSETNGEGFPYTIRRDEVDILAQALDPFTSRKKRLQEITRTLRAVFGLSEEDVDLTKQKYAIDDVDSYLSDLDTRWERRKIRNHDVRAETNRELFAGFVELFDTYLNIYTQVDRIVGNEDGFAKTKFSTKYDHFSQKNKPQYDSPHLEHEILQLEATVDQTGREITALDMCDLVAAEIQDVRDQEEAFRLDPHNRDLILQPSDYIGDSLKFFADQRESLETTLVAFQHLIRAPRHSDETTRQEEEKDRKKFIDRLSRRWGARAQDTDEFLQEKRKMLFNKMRSDISHETMK